MLGRSSAEEAAAAGAKVWDVGKGTWSRGKNTSDENTNQEILHPGSCKSKLSAISSSSIDIKDYGDDDNFSGPDDGDESLQKHGTIDEHFQSHNSLASSLSASNYSFSAAVAPICVKEKNSNSGNKSSNIERDEQRTSG